MTYEYDRHEWSSLATRIECKDPQVKPDVSFERVNTDTKRDVRGQLDRAKVAAKLTGGSEAAGKGKHRGQERGFSEGAPTTAAAPTIHNARGVEACRLL